MPAPLSDSTISLVKATVPALQAHGTAITQRMYQRLFQDPAMQALFNASHHGEGGSQPRALAQAVLAYARHIDNLGALAGMVERIAQKHVGLTILPEHYPAVGEALLAAIQDILGAAATPEIMAAWGEAYWFLARILIGREAQIYEAHLAAPGGWQGWRDFVVARKVEESRVITSFHLRPVDGGPVLAHRPGQYLTLLLQVPGHGALKRNYSVSSAPGTEEYRISVKREPRGLASNWLHDVAVVGTRLQLSAPAGDFVLREPRGPVVLLSGGVGQTPLVSMLEVLAAQHPDVAVQVVHATQDGATHALGGRLRQIAAASAGRISAHVFYEAPRPEDLPGRDHDARGRVTLDWLRARTPLSEADYYLCGPRGFLASFSVGLRQLGVPADRVHLELFGPADEALAA